MPGRSNPLFGETHLAAKIFPRRLASKQLWELDAVIRKTLRKFPWLVSTLIEWKELGLRNEQDVRGYLRKQARANPTRKRGQSLRTPYIKFESLVDELAFDDLPITREELADRMAEIDDPNLPYVLYAMMLFKDRGCRVFEGLVKIGVTHVSPAHKIPTRRLEQHRHDFGVKFVVEGRYPYPLYLGELNDGTMCYADVPEGRVLAYAAEKSLKYEMAMKYGKPIIGTETFSSLSLPDVALLVGRVLAEERSRGG